jgi:hypothetical protein
MFKLRLEHSIELALSESLTVLRLCTVNTRQPYAIITPVVLLFCRSRSCWNVAGDDDLCVESLQNGSMVYLLVCRQMRLRSLCLNRQSTIDSLYSPSFADWAVVALLCSDTLALPRGSCSVDADPACSWQPWPPSLLPC